MRHRGRLGHLVEPGIFPVADDPQVGLPIEPGIVRPVDRLLQEDVLDVQRGEQVAELGQLRPLFEEELEVGRPRIAGLVGNAGQFQIVAGDHRATEEVHRRVLHGPIAGPRI